MKSLQNKVLAALAVTASLFAFSACSTVPTESSSNTTAPATTAPVEETTATPVSATDAAVVATGTFEGRSDHIVTGNVSITESEGRYIIQLADDFSLDNAPDPKVGLGNDGYDASTKAGHLVALTGASTYEVPESVNIQDYNEVYIWCEKFGVPLGVAKLQVQ